MLGRTMAGALRAAGRALVMARRLVPAVLVPVVVRARWSVAWSRASVREDARRQMAFLLDRTRPGADVERAARGYALEMARRGELRWHPRLATEVRLDGAEHLVDAAALGRGVVVSFVHHGLYDRAFTAVARIGVPLHMVVHPYMVRPDAPAWIRQHVHVNRLGGGVPVSAEVGTRGLAELLGQGNAVAVASDVPGRTPVTFAGRSVLGSFGAARLAMDNKAPVVLLTSERVAGVEQLRLHPALEPTEFESPQALLAELLARHEAAVLAWPEAADLPCSRWDVVAETSAVT